MKVVLQYDNWGRMGNRMFVYALGWILANNKKCELIGTPLPNFINTTDIHTKLFTSNNFIQTRQTYGDNFIDIDELLNTEKDIIINSFAQKAEYYIDYRDNLEMCFYINNLNVDSPKDDELVIHIRESDYKTLNIAIPTDFYMSNIKNLNYKYNTIVTDDCNSPLVLALQRELGCQIKSKSPVDSFNTTNDIAIMQDYTYMLSAKNLLISHSTFSWWPAFLGCKKTVYYPIYQGSPWKEQPGKNDVNLYLKEFIKIK